MRRKIIFKLITCCPSNAIRVFIYRHLLHYSIGKYTRIGKSIINAKNVRIGHHVTIRHNTTIACNRLTIGHHTAILSGNTITGKGNFTIGHHSRIINNHFIDLWNSVSIGHHTWIAGRDSQIWTHGSLHTQKNTKDLSVYIGNHNYIGSRVSIAPGVHLSDLNLIGLGSVVTRTIQETNSLITGNPATVIKTNIDWRKYW